jgi:hypothetical protein
MLLASKDSVGEHIGANSEIYLDCILVNSFPQSHIPSKHDYRMNFEEAIVSSDCLDPGFRASLQRPRRLDRGAGFARAFALGHLGGATRHVSVNLDN